MDQHPKTNNTRKYLEKSITKFLKEEITEAKETLWRTSGESVLGRLVSRQDPTKTASEISDICSALKAFSETNMLPMFLSTSDMVVQTPIYIAHPVQSDSTELNARLKVIEESLNSIMPSYGSNNESIESGPASTVVGETNLSGKNEQLQTKKAPEKTTSGNTQAAVPVDHLNLAVTELSNGEKWTKVTDKTKKNNAAKTWRQRLNILRGTAVNDNEGESLSADVHLVAYGLSKKVTGYSCHNGLQLKVYTF